LIWLFGSCTALSKFLVFELHTTFFLLFVWFKQFAHVLLHSDISLSIIIFCFYNIYFIHLVLVRSISPFLVSDCLSPIG